MLDQRIERRCQGPGRVQSDLIGEARVPEDKLHVHVDGPNGADGTNAAKEQQPKRTIPEQEAISFGGDAGIFRCQRGAVRMLAQLGGLSFKREHGERPGREHERADDEERRLESVAVGDSFY